MNCNHKKSRTVHKGKEKVCLECWEAGFKAAKEFYAEYQTFDVMEALGIKRADEVRTE